MVSQKAQLSCRANNKTVYKPNVENVETNRTVFERFVANRYYYFFFFKDVKNIKRKRARRHEQWAQCAHPTRRVLKKIEKKKKPRRPVLTSANNDAQTVRPDDGVRPLRPRRGVWSCRGDPVGGRARRTGCGRRRRAKRRNSDAVITRRRRDDDDRVTATSRTTAAACPRARVFAATARVLA